MPLPAVGIIVALSSILTAIAKWIVEMAVMYGKKIAFYSIVVALFFASLYAVSSIVFSALETATASQSYAQVAQYFSLLVTIFPSNFYALASLIITIEFQIFFWRWAMKVLDIKVSFFGS